MDVFANIVTKIIQEQEQIIGPVALEQARQVSGLKITWEKDKHDITIDGDSSEVVNNLVKKYQGLFGQTSVEVCKDAVASMLSQLPAAQVPALLK
jgi:hypothetical protein